MLAQNINLPKLTYPQQVIFKKFLDQFVDEDITELWKEISKFNSDDYQDDDDFVEIIEDTTSQAHQNMQVRYETIPVKPRGFC